MQLLTTDTDQDSAVPIKYENLPEYGDARVILEALSRIDHSALAVFEKSGLIRIKWFVGDEVETVVSIAPDGSREGQIFRSAITAPEGVNFDADYPIRALIAEIHGLIDRTTVYALRTITEGDGTSKLVSSAVHTIRQLNQAIRILSFPTNPPAEPASA